MSGPTVVLAVSGHGFGHAVRVAEVATALLDLGARVVVRTDAPAMLFPIQVEMLTGPSWPLDIGVVQHDGLDLDVDETRQRWTAFASSFDERADIEAELLRAHGADIVLGDIPPLAFAAAGRAGLPSLALGNFGWDWIYEPWPKFSEPIATIQAGYAQADALLRLPLHSSSADAFPAFRHIQDVPLVARWPRTPRSEVRAVLQVDDRRPLVLLSFGGFTARGIDLAALGRWRDYVFVVTPPLSAALPSIDPPCNVRAVSWSPSDYVSLLAACDAVVTKPGYGMAVDCLANRVAMLFTDRGPFREYDVMADQLPRLGRARYVPQPDVLHGELGAHLDALLTSDVVWTQQPMDGADVVAQIVLEYVAERRHRDGFTWQTIPGQNADC